MSVDHRALVDMLAYCRYCRSLSILHMQGSICLEITREVSLASVAPFPRMSKTLPFPQTSSSTEVGTLDCTSRDPELLQG